MTPDEQYRYYKRWRLDRSRGITRYIDPAPTRSHIAALLGAGASYRAIADASGVSVQAVTKVHHGQKNVRRDTATKILAVTRGQLHARDHGDKFVPDLGTRRRIRALMTLGHSHADTAAAAGWGRQPRIVANLLHQQGAWVTKAKHDGIDAAYRALSRRTGSSSRTKAAALRYGYPGPMAWDDIDDPDETPVVELDESGGAVPRTRDHGSRTGVDADSLTDCAEWGMTVTESARRLGVTQGAIERGVARHAPQLRDRFTRNAIAHEYRNENPARPVARISASTR